MSRRALHLSCLLVLGTLCMAASAGASTTYPEALRNKLSLAEFPNPPKGCKLCHTDDEGGLQNVSRPFGRSLMKVGALGGSVPSLFAALKSLEADGADSDGDGVDDIAELKAATDPNVAMTSMGEPIEQEQIPLPETGCGVAQRRGPSPVAWGWLLLAGSALALRRRRF